MKLTRLKPGQDGEQRYYHPHGFTITKRRRDWSLRGYERGALGATEATAPREWWEITYSFRRPRETSAPGFRTLKAAREWCDVHYLPRTKKETKT
jgi:hypothetical protein